MAYEKQKATFLESKATWVSYVAIPGMRAFQLTREWKAVDDKEKSANVTYLTAFVSAKNEAASRTVLDPQADGSGTLEGGLPKNVFPGLWRHVSTSWSAERNSYVQVLRRGYATALSWDEAILVSGQGEPGFDRSLKLRWDSIDPSHLDDLVRSLNDGSSGIFTAGFITNPTIGGDVYTGTWAVGNVSLSWGDDGSGVVTIDVVKAYLIGKKADLADITPRREVIREVVRPFGRGGLYTGNPPLENSFNRGIKLIYEHLLPASRTVLEGLTGADLQPRLGTGWSFTDSKVESDGKGGLTFTIIGQLVSRRPWVAGMAPDLTGYSGIGTSSPNASQTWLSIRNADHDAVMAYLLSGAGAVANYSVRSVVPSDNNDGSTDYTRGLSYTGGTILRPEMEPRFFMMEDGVTIERKEHPHDILKHLVRWHYITNERLYTNNRDFAILWAGQAPVTGSLTAGRTGGQPAVSGYWAAREKGQTEYVSYRITKDFCTDWYENPAFPGFVARPTT